MWIRCSDCKGLGYKRKTITSGRSKGQRVTVTCPSCKGSKGARVQ